MGWPANPRPALCLVKARDEINTRWPGRDKASDGYLGDPAHAAQGSASDHNPFITDSQGRGVVRAMDIDVDGINAAALFAHFCQLGRAGDHRLAGGTWHGQTFTGYAIFNRTIAGPWTGWSPRAYNGDDPHTSHIHVSFGPMQAQYDDAHTWSIAAIPNGGHTTTGSGGPKAGSRVLRRGDIGPDVTWLERRLGHYYHGAIDTVFGPQLDSAVHVWQRDHRLTVDGIVGPQTWRSLGAIK